MPAEARTLLRRMSEDDAFLAESQTLRGVKGCRREKVKRALWRHERMFHGADEVMMSRDRGRAISPLVAFRKGLEEAGF